MEPAARPSSTSGTRNSRDPDRNSRGPDIGRGLFVLDIWNARRLFILMLALSMSAVNATQRRDPRAFRRAEKTGFMGRADSNGPHRTHGD